MEWCQILALIPGFALNYICVRVYVKGEQICGKKSCDVLVLVQMVNKVNEDPPAEVLCASIL